MRKILLLTAFVLLQSCQIAGLTNDYSKLKDSQKAMIADGQFGNLNNKHIYKITGKELREEVLKQPKALVYIFKNGCASEYCKLMKTYEIYAKEHGYTLYLVMDGFGNLDSTLEQRNAFESPLFAIKSEAYNTIYRGKYSKMFREELIETQGHDTNWGGLFFFEGGKFITEMRGLPNG